MTSRLTQLHAPSPRPVATLSQAHTLGRSLAATSSLFLPSSPAGATRCVDLNTCADLNTCTQLLLAEQTGLLHYALQLDQDQRLSKSGVAQERTLFDAAQLSDCFCRCREPLPATSLHGRSGQSKSLQRILSKTRLAGDSAMRSPRAVDAAA